MPKGWRSKHRPTRPEQSRWSLFTEAAGDLNSLPWEILERIVVSLTQRLDRLNPSEGSTAKAHIQAMAAEFMKSDPLERNFQKLLPHSQQLLNAHRLNRARPYLENIANGEILRASHIPAVLRLQRDALHLYVKRQFPDGLQKDDSVLHWFRRNQKRLHEELSFYQCLCCYRPELDLSDEELIEAKGPGSVIPAILSGLHSGLSVGTVNQYLKESSRRPKLPPYFA